jgi:undecaprenyl-diphosphatase
MRYGLYALAFALALVAVMVWPFDQALSDLLRVSGHSQGSLFLWRVLQPVKLFGKGEILLLLGFILAIHRWKQAAVVACIAMLLAGLVVTPMKFVFERQRPNGRNMQSFPSGDAAAVTAFLVPIATAFPAAKLVAVAGVAAIGLARIAVGLHFPSDILAGIAIGVFSSAVVLSRNISLKPKVRRLLRRSWLPAVLGVFVVIRLFIGSGSNMREFFSIFGPAVALLTVAPFIRALLRHRMRNGIASIGWERTLTLGFAAILFAWVLFLLLLS